MGIYTKGGSINAVISDTSVTRGRYTTDSALRVTPVSGSTFTGETAPDGSVNVTNYDGLRGLYHPSGAIRGFFSNSETALSGLYHRSGALNLYASVSNATLELIGETNGLSLNFIDNSSDIVTSGVSVKSTATSSITFTRASSATRVNSSGFIETVSTNVARLDHDPVTLAPKGLLVEEQRTNLLLRSNSPTVGSWIFSNTTGTANTSDVVDPAGTNTATKLVSNSSGGALLQSVLSTAVAHTGSIWLRTASGTLSSSIFVYRASPYALVATKSITITSAWQRFDITGNFIDTSAHNFQIQTGISATVYMYGAQLEAGSFATSYIPTVASTVTRSPDVATIAASSFPYSVNTSALIISASQLSSSALNSWLYSFDNGTGNDRFFTIVGPNGPVNTQLTSNLVGQFNQSITPSSTTAPFTSGFTYAVNNANMAVNGVLGTTDTTLAVPTASATTLRIGTNTLQTVFFNGHFRQITYIPRRISNSELQARTTL